MSTLCDLADEADERLVRQIVEGDQRAFAVLMRRYNQRLYRAARSILQDDDEARDAVQEAWWKAYCHLHDFQFQAALPTWLTRILINEALMRRRRNESRRAVIQYGVSDENVLDRMANRFPSSPPSIGAQPELEVWRAEVRALIEHRVDVLPDRYRSVFVLRAIEELDTAEVAAILELPQATVRVRYMRARRLLRSGLQQLLDEQAPAAFTFAGARCDRIVADVLARMQAAAKRQGSVDD